MNCLKCINNYYFLEDINSCYTGEIDNYYLDKNINKYRRCYKNCLRCSTAPEGNNINCLKCINEYYFLEDINSCYTGDIDNLLFN